MSRLLSISKTIDSMNEKLGWLFCWLVVAFMGIIVWDVVARYVFLSPLLWGSEMATILFVGYFLVGGAYTLRYHGHVNVDLLVSRLSDRKKAIFEIFTFIFLLFFSIILLWQGTEMAWRSWAIKETSPSAWGGPIYPIKTFIAIGPLLLLIQGISNFLHTLISLKERKKGNE